MQGFLASLSILPVCFHSSNYLATPGEVDVDWTKDYPTNRDEAINYDLPKWIKCVVSRNVSVCQPWIQKREIKSLFQGMCQSVNHGYRRKRSRACFEECVSLSTMDTEESEQELVSSVLSKCICLPPLHYPPTWMWQDQKQEDSDMEEDQEARVKRWRAILQTEAEEKDMLLETKSTIRQLHHINTVVYR